MADILSMYENLEMLQYCERRCSAINDRTCDLDILDETDFRSRYRFDKETIENITRLLSPSLEPVSERVGTVSSVEKVCSAIRFFAEGCFQRTIGDVCAFSQPSTCRAIHSVAKSLAELRPLHVKFPTEMERQEISQRFYQMSGFPGVLGTLDCTHVPISNPGGENSELFRCRKGFFSLNVQTLSDEKLKIRNIVVRWPGGTHDSTIFENSYLRAILESSDIPNNYHVLGDSGYPLRHYLLTPYLSPITDQERRYNSAHIYARNSVERQYGVWKRRFACLSEKSRTHLSNTQTIIVATAVLHNIAVDLGDTYEFGSNPDDPEPTNLPDSVAGIAKRNNVVRSFFT